MTHYSEGFKYVWWNHFITGLLTRKEALGLSDEDHAFLLTIPPTRFALVQKELWKEYWGSIIVHPRTFEPEKMKLQQFAFYRNNSASFWAHVLKVLRSETPKNP